MTLTLTILGCGSSGGVPRAGAGDAAGMWGACDPSEPRNTRRRCAVLLRRTGPHGETLCVIDTGPDFRAQMLSEAVHRLDAVVYTHEHADHLHGIDDLRPFAIASRALVPVWMDDATFARARTAFGYCFATPEGSAYPPILERRRIDPARPVVIDGPGGAITLRPVPVVHGDIEALGFRIGDVLYLPDVSAVPETSLPLFAGLDVLVLDALRHRPHPSHFCLADALAFSARVAPRRTILTNLHIDLDYRTLLHDTPAHIEPAHDGLTLTVEP